MQEGVPSAAVVKVVPAGHSEQANDPVVAE